MNPGLCHAESRIHKISSTLSKVIGDWGGGGGGRVLAFYSVKLCVMINFILRYNVFCFNFVVVLHSMFCLYAIIKVVLLNEKVVMCNNNLRLKSLLTRSTDHQRLLKRRNFDFAHFSERGGDSYLKSDF